MYKLQRAAIAPHNQALAQRSLKLQNRLLDGSDHGVIQFIAVGVGQQTLAGITERRGWFGLTERAERFTDGDQFVPVLSADLGYSHDAHQAEGYIGNLSGVAYFNESHTTFAQSSAVRGTVRAWLQELE